MHGQPDSSDGSGPEQSSYWNHNSAYHPWIRRRVAHRGGSVLDVGCGDGLLLEHLSGVCREVVGVEVDQGAADRARSRLAAIPSATVVRCGFADYRPDSRRFSVVTFVASLHHLPLETTLRRSAELLEPGGSLLVVGLAARATAVDWLLSGLAIPVVRAANLLHREVRDIGVPVAPPREDLREIRRTARTVLPGVRIRRALYYRYLLHWDKPSRAAAR